MGQLTMSFNKINVKGAAHFLLSGSRGMKCGEEQWGEFGRLNLSNITQQRTKWTDNCNDRIVDQEVPSNSSQRVDREEFKRS